MLRFSFNAHVFFAQQVWQIFCLFYFHRQLNVIWVSILCFASESWILMGSVNMHIFCYSNGCYDYFIWQNGSTDSFTHKKGCWSGYVIISYFASYLTMCIISSWDGVGDDDDDDNDNNNKDEYFCLCYLWDCTQILPQKCVKAEIWNERKTENYVNKLWISVVR